MAAEISSFRKVLAQQAVSVFIAATLPRALRVAEVDLYPGFDRQSFMLGHFCALVPCQGFPQVLGQFSNLLSNCSTDGLGTVAGKSRAIFQARPATMARHRRQVQEKGETRAALDQRANRRAFQTKN